MSFDDFSDQVEAYLMEKNGWTGIQVADFISPRTRRLIQDYLGHRNIQHTVQYTATNPARFEKLWR